MGSILQHKRKKSQKFFHDKILMLSLQTSKLICSIARGDLSAQVTTPYTGPNYACKFWGVVDYTRYLAVRQKELSIFPRIFWRKLKDILFVKVQQYFFDKIGFSLTTAMAKSQQSFYFQCHLTNLFSCLRSHICSTR